MFSVTVAAGQTVGIDIDEPAGSSLNSWIRLFDAYGAELAFNNDGRGPGEGSSGESYLEYRFALAGTYFVGVSGAFNNAYDALLGAGDVTGSTGSYTLVLTGGDPDDQLSEAVAIGAAETRAGLDVDSPTDVDMFSVTVATGQTVGIDIDEPAGVSLNSWIRLFDAYGVELAFNNDGRGPGEGSDGETYVEDSVALAGTYYVGVSGAFNNAYDALLGAGDVTGSTGSYTLVLTGGDPDDTLSEAVAIGTAETRTGLAIDSPTDVDMFSITVAAGQTVGIDIDEPAGSGLNSWIRLFDVYGGQLAFNNDGRGPGEGFSGESYLEYRFALAGTYYLGVSGAFNSGSDPVTGTADIPGSTGSYTLILSAAPGPPAPGPSTDGDPDDQISEAIPIDTTETRTGSIDSPTGVDMFSFTVVAGQTVGFDIDRPPLGLNSAIRLFDAYGAELASNDNGAGPGEGLSGESYLEYRFVGAGTYYLAVSGALNNAYDPLLGTGDVTGSFGLYTLVLTSGDPDDTLSEAVPIGTAETRTGLEV